MSATGASAYLDEMRANRRRSVLLLAATFALLLVVANVVAFLFGGYRSTSCSSVTSYGGRTGCVSRVVFHPAVLGVTVALAGGYVLISYLGSARAALSLTGARPAKGPEYQQLNNLVEGLSIAAGTPKPDVYVIDDPAPNAFATGRSPKRSAVVATTGLLDLMSRRELEGVLAHEMSHVRNRDTSVMTLAVLAVGGIVVITDILLRLAWFGALTGGGRDRDDRDSAGLFYLVSLLLYALAVPAALLLRAALSRRREALADASAVELTRYPSGLRSALEKLEADSTVVSHTSHATAHLWIESPLEREKDRGGTFGRLFDTHPPLSERIALLRGYEGRDPAGRGPNDPPPNPRRSVSAAGPSEPVAADDVNWQPDEDAGWGPGRGGGPMGGGPGGGGPFGGGPFGRGPFGGAGQLGLGGPGGGAGRGRGRWGTGGRILGGLGASGAPPGFGGSWVGKGRGGNWPDGPWDDEPSAADDQRPVGGSTEPGRGPSESPGSTTPTESSDSASPPSPERGPEGDHRG